MAEKVDPYKYMKGFGNHFTSEALEDALPKGVILSFSYLLLYKSIIL